MHWYEFFGDGQSNVANCIFPRPNPVATATKFGTKWAITCFASEIFCELFAPIRVFRGWAIRCCKLHFSTTDPRCHVKEIWNKMGYSLACVRVFCEILTPIMGFSKMGHRMLPTAFFLDRPPTRCHGNEIWYKIVCKSLCVKNFCEFFCAYMGFRGWAIECCQVRFYPTDPLCHGN